MDPSRLQTWQERYNAVRASRARLLVEKPGSGAYKEARRGFRDLLIVVWPVGAYEALKGPFDDPRVLDLVLTYLEDDPVEHRSGYLKERMLQRLPRWDLHRSDRRRVAGIVLSAVDGPGRREFRRVCTAARHADPDILLPGLVFRLDSEDPSLVWRAFCAARGMLSLPHPRGHFTHDRSSHGDTEIERLQSRLEAYAEARRDENLSQIAAMRERLRVLLEAR